MKTADKIALAVVALGVAGGGVYMWKNAQDRQRAATFEAAGTSTSRGGLPLPTAPSHTVLGKLQAGDIAGGVSDGIHWFGGLFSSLPA